MMRTLVVPVAALAIAACGRGPAALDSCAPVAPSAYRLEVPVGEMRLPGRLDLACLPGGRAWGRLLISMGADTITGAVRFAGNAADTLEFTAGGAIVGLVVVRSEGDSARGAIQLAGDRSFPFVAAVDTAGPPEDLARHATLEPFRPGVVSTDSGESYPVPRADGTLLFTRHGADLGRQRIMMAAPDGVRGLLEMPDGASDRSPSLSPDGSLLLFASTRSLDDPAPTRNQTALWFLRATNGRWSAPQPVVWPSEDRPASPQQPALTADGALFFVDDREDGAGGRDVYQARWEDGAVSQVTRVTAPVSTAADEAGVYVSPDGRTMIVARTAGPGHRGGDDLYVHTRTAGAWSDPINLDLPVNTFANEYAPWLEADNRLWFTSDRFGSGDLFSVEVARNAAGGLTVVRR